MSVPEPERLHVLGLSGGRWQGFRTIAGMVAVITAVLAGSAVGLLVTVAAGHSLVAALAAGGAIAVVALGGLTRYQRSAWATAAAAPLSFDQAEAEPRQK